MIYVNKGNVEVMGDAQILVAEYFSLTMGLTKVLVETFGNGPEEVKSMIKAMVADAVDKYDSEEFYEPSGTQEIRPSH